MTIARGFGFGETHLMPDAIVAFVDEELSTTATQRARDHLGRCPYCAAEASAQREARDRLRGLDDPGMPSGLLDSLRAIPQDTQVSAVPDGLAMTSDGQLVSVQRPERAAAMLGDRAPLGATAPLGAGDELLGAQPRQRKTGKRAAQGAGALVSGLMLGALALGLPGSAQHPAQQAPNQVKRPVTTAPQAAFKAGAANQNRQRTPRHPAQPRQTPPTPTHR